jgi:hypothetical protein
MTKIELPHDILSLKQQIQRLEKKQIAYKGKPIKITADFSTETLIQEEHGVRFSKH